MKYTRMSSSDCIHFPSEGGGGDKGYLHFRLSHVESGGHLVFLRV